MIDTLRPHINVTSQNALDGGGFAACLYLKGVQVLSAYGTTAQAARVKALRLYRELLTASTREVCDMIEVELETRS